MGLRRSRNPKTADQPGDAHSIDWRRHRGGPERRPISSTLSRVIPSNSTPGAAGPRFKSDARSRGAACERQGEESTAIACSPKPVAEHDGKTLIRAS
jgi:hypothetical protein